MAKVAHHKTEHELLKNLLDARMERIAKAEEVDNKLKVNRYLQFLSDIGEEGLLKTTEQAEKDRIQFVKEFSELSPDKRLEIERAMERERNT
jgi:hypothetical protein